MKPKIAIFANETTILTTGKYIEEAEIKLEKAIYHIVVPTIRTVQLKVQKPIQVITLLDATSA